jgi:hypothetical protein
MRKNVFRRLLPLALAACLSGCPGDQAASPPPTANPNPGGDTPFAAISRTEIKTDLTATKKAAEAYHAAEGKWPASVDELVQADFLKPESAQDPWGRPYVLKAQGNAINVYSYGADGKPGGQNEDADWDSGSAGLGATGS